MDAREPDWERWMRATSLRAWECLALSVDVEPRELGVDHFLVLRSCEGGASLASDKDPEWLLQMCARLTELLQVLADAPAGLRAGRAKAVSMEADLKLGGFIDWAVSRKWTLPKALAASATVEPAKASSGEATAKPAAKAQSSAKSKAAGKAGSSAKAATKKPAKAKGKGRK